MRLFAIFFFISITSPAQEIESTLTPIEVFGADTEALEQSAAPERVIRQRLEAFQYTDVNRALKQISGIYVREEDGQGLRPNIGLRGTDPDRSKKIVLLEDGVLLGPAPYSSPAAYYTPSMNHIESLEVYKGFAATGIGPNSVGGAVNYITPGIPPKAKFKFETMGGSYSTLNSKISAGGPTSFGGFWIGGSRLDSKGFKKIDGGGDAGFHKNDLLGKLRFNLPGNGARTHRLELKLGYTDEVSNETYLGITRADFNDSPYRRYVASALDQMRWVHHEYQLTHALQLSEHTLLETTAYRHGFHRIWYRFDRFRDDTVNVAEVLNDPKGGSNSINYDILRGARDSSVLGTNGQLVHANNDRRFLSQGVQSRFTTSVSADGYQFEPEFFLRYHTDQINRNHTSNSYEMVSGREIKTSDPTQTDAVNEDAAHAWTAVATTPIKHGEWILTPILRFETVHFNFIDSLNNALSLGRNDRSWLPGLSLLKTFGEHFSARVSVNKASTLAGLASNGDEAKEQATNYEIELKYRNPQNQLEADLTGFKNDNQHLTGVCGGAEGCFSSAVDTFFNGGRADVSGIESRVAKGFNVGKVFVSVQGTATLKHAVHASDFDSQSPEWGVGAIHAGDPLPYVPRIQYSLSLGAQWRAFKQDLSIVYQGPVYDRSVLAERQTIDGYGIIDWAASYQVSKPLQILGRIDNLLAKQYAVSNVPFGFRSGKPQSFNVGLIYQF